MKLLILEEAAADLEAGKAFYESLQQGMGEQFIGSLLKDLDSLTRLAGIHRVEFGFYRMLTKRFPYAIYYELRENSIRVHAILDMRRDPARRYSRFSK